MTTAEELVYLKEIVLKGIGNPPHGLYKEVYENVYGPDSCALTCEFPISNSVTVRFCLDYKRDSDVFSSNISVSGGAPVVLKVHIDNIMREEQLRNFAIMTSIELFNFIYKIVTEHQKCINKERGILRRLRRGISAV